MFAPENEALAVGAAQNLLAALQFDEGLRRNGNVTAGADAFFNSHNDGMFQAFADEFVAHEHRLGDGFADLGAFGIEIGKRGVAFLQLFFKAVTLYFQFGLYAHVGQVNFGQRVFLELQFFHEGHFFFFTGAVHFFHAVHFTHHGMVFARIFHLHKLVFAFLDAGAVIVDFKRQALLLILKVGQLVHYIVALRFTGAETLFKRIQFAGGTLHVLPYCVNGVINFLQLDKLLYLFKVNGIIHLLDPPEDS